MLTTKYKYILTLLATCLGFYFFNSVLVQNKKKSKDIYLCIFKREPWLKRHIVYFVVAWIGRVPMDHHPIIAYTKTTLLCIFLLPSFFVI